MSSQEAVFGVAVLAAEPSPRAGDDGEGQDGQDDGNDRARANHQPPAAALGCRYRCAGLLLLAATFARSQEALYTDEHQHQHADHDSGPPRAQCSVELDQGLSNAENEHAQQGAEYIPRATRQHRATHDHRSDDFQLGAVCVQTMPG